ncbi:hypothetical protein [Wenzhouxiangella sediminis]|uniref:hypothetical protein n=1 Tax=Wenzhouxiangella sediminis TaxID=1792836 RepID=UPI0015F265A3|nr:hypothetical protein [Wenzhouxiangella sediminis]
MSPSIQSPAPHGNPVVAARRAMWANLLKEVVDRPALSGLVGLLGLASVVLVLGLLYSLAQAHAGTVLVWLRRWGAAAWAAVFLLCLAGLVPSARRDLAEAASGWLSALPQMPWAMRVWSRWRSFGLALMQAVFLLAALVSVHRLAPGDVDLTVFDWLPAFVVPMLAWLILPLLARPQATSSASRRSRSRPGGRCVARERRSVLSHWQWTDYKSRRWTAGMRWSLGLLVLLVPAGASFLQVGMTLLLGALLLQWLQFWTSSLRVVVQASSLTAALPQRPGPFVLQLCVLPALLVVSLALFVFGLAALMGLSVPAALVVALALTGALSLHAASVLAWRHRPRLTGLRSTSVLLTWGTLSQAAPFTAPLIWLGCFAWLLRLAAREAP